MALSGDVQLTAATGDARTTCAHAVPRPSPGTLAVLRTCIARIGGDDSDDAFTLGAITLHPHQVEGARRLRAALLAHGGALLADEVGLGKTFTALAVARHEPTVLIVAPASLREMWRDASRRCAVAAEVTSYERLSVGRTPDGGPWSLVILDEAHHARSPATRRYRALTRLTRGARVLCLSATPIHNRRDDLSALLALFLGAGAERLDDAALGTIVVRRRVSDVQRPIPALGAVVRHEIPVADDVLPALRALPPPLPPSDGGVAQALVALQLTRAWCSSDAAFLAAIQRRLATAAALEHALECGRLPSRRDLSAWTADADGSIQLALPQLFAAPAPPLAVRDALEVVRAHTAALRSLRSLLRGSAARDAERFAILAQVLAHRVTSRDRRQAVVFTHSVETAERAFRTLQRRFRLALLTGRGARLASGPVPRREVLAAFAPDGGVHIRPDHARRIDVLIASDVASEGIDLQRASVIIHLDLPWTVARLEQRMGRLRRMGSPHECIEAHLIAPPAGAEALASSLRHLARKAIVTAQAVGASSILAGIDEWAGLIRAVERPSPTVARERVQELLRACATFAEIAQVVPCDEVHDPGDDSSPHEWDDTRRFAKEFARRQSGDVSLCDAADRAPLLRNRPVPCARWVVPTTSRPAVVALVSIDGTAHLLVGDRSHLTTDPAEVVSALEELNLALMRATGAADEAHASAPVPKLAADGTCSSASDRRLSDPNAEDAEDPEDAVALQRAVIAWCEQRAAALTLAPPSSASSRSHRRLLHLLVELPARTPRAARHRIAARTSYGRSLVLAQAGAGAERQLEAFATSCPHASAGARAAERWLDDLIAELERSPSGSLHGATDTLLPPVVVEAILTLVPG